MLIIPPLFTTLLACHPGPTDSGDSGPGGDTVTVMRDSHGVPHIFGETVDAVQYAHGYAQAQDHLEPMLVGFLIAEGELSTALEEGAALLVETGSYKLYDALWVVSCAADTQLARLMARQGIGEAEARRWIDSQLPLAEKEAVATHVIHNDGDLAGLEAAVRAAWGAFQS